MCIECLFIRSPGRVPYRTPSACAKRAAYPNPPPVVPVPLPRSRGRCTSLFGRGATTWPFLLNTTMTINAQRDSRQPLQSIGVSSPRVCQHPAQVSRPPCTLNPGEVLFEMCQRRVLLPRLADTATVDTAETTRPGDKRGDKGAHSFDSFSPLNGRVSSVYWVKLDPLRGQPACAKSASYPDPPVIPHP